MNKEKWIPFVEVGHFNLPPADTEILVTDGKYVFTDKFYTDPGFGKTMCYLDSETDLTKLAWLPLPEPWKGEENE